MIKKCEECNKKFNSRLSIYRFCSHKCSCVNKTKTSKVTKKCPICGNDFSHKKSIMDKKKFCSIECFHTDSRNKANKLTKRCIYCGKEYTGKRSKIKKQKYCSRECLHSAKSGKNSHFWDGGLKTKICVVCKSKYKIKKSFDDRRSTCSKKCMGILRKGENNHRWKGGISPLRDMIRGLSEARQWRKKVFERDNYTCQDCGVRSKQGVKVYLEAHHVKSFAELLAEFLQEYNQFSPFEDKDTLVRLAMKWQPFWEISNGKTLCKTCHNLTKKGVTQYVE